MAVGLHAELREGDVRPEGSGPSDQPPIQAWGCEAFNTDLECPPPVGAEAKIPN